MAFANPNKAAKLFLVPQKCTAAHHLLPIHQMEFRVVNIASQKEDVITLGVI